VFEIETTNHDSDFFYIVLAGQSVTDLRDHRYAAIRASNKTTDSNGGPHETFQELSRAFQDILDNIGEHGEPSASEHRVQLSGGDALYLHRCHIAVMEEAKKEDDDRLKREHYELASELEYEIGRAGGLPIIKLLHQRTQDDFPDA